MNGQEAGHEATHDSQVVGKAILRPPVSITHLIFYRIVF